MHLEIAGLPIKPYVRMTQKGKWSSPQAQEYMCNQQALRSEIYLDMLRGKHKMLPAQTPLWIAIVYVAPVSQGHRCDLDNITKAVLDACNGIVYPDDRWIDSIDIRRYFGDPYLTIDCDVMERSER